MALKMTLEGDKEMKARLKNLASDFPLEARRGANVVIKRKLALTQERVPVKTGNLKKTGRVTVSLAKAGGQANISASILYGGQGVLYARRVHEDLKAKHKRGGQAKFVESVLLEAVPTVGGELATEIDLKKVVKP